MMPRTPAPLTVAWTDRGMGGWIVEDSHGHHVADFIEEADARAFVALPALQTLLKESTKLLRHEAGCMAGWAEVGVIYEDKRCSCHVKEWADKVDAALAQADGPAPTETTK